MKHKKQQKKIGDIDNTYSPCSVWIIFLDLVMSEYEEK